MLIRAAGLDERFFLIELQRRASLANPGDRAAVEAHPDAVDVPEAQFDAGQVFVAEVDGEVCGFAAYELRADGNVELDGLFVEPTKWRRGIAGALVADGAVRARAAGAAAIHVIGNPHAQGFYLAAGFEELGPTQTEFGPATNYVLKV
ncbi:MAG: GNAT family N-acetyltransferase [Aeromicrobium sp.]